MFGGSKEFAKLPPAVQEVVVDLAFNMGMMGLRGFPQFIKDIKAHHWKRAAQDIKYKDRANTQKGKSKYYTTLKSRAKKNISKLMKLYDQKLKLEKKSHDH